MKKENYKNYGLLVNIKEMRYVLLFGLLLGVLLISNVNAVDLGTFKQGDCLKVIQVCSNCTFINITSIIFPNSTIDSINSNMSRDNNVYTYEYCNTNEAGSYIVSGFGNPDGVEESWTYNVVITKSGKSLDISSAILNGAILVMMLGVTIFFYLFSNATQVPSIKLFFNIVSYISLILMVGTGYIVLQSSNIQTNISDTVNYLIVVVGIIFVMIILFLLLNSTLQALALYKQKKGYTEENTVF